MGWDCERLDGDSAPLKEFTDMWQMMVNEMDPEKDGWLGVRCVRVCVCVGVWVCVGVGVGVGVGVCVCVGGCVGVCGCGCVWVWVWV